MELDEDTQNYPISAENMLPNAANDDEYEFGYIHSNKSTGYDEISREISDLNKFVGSYDGSDDEEDRNYEVRGFNGGSCAARITEDAENELVFLRLEYARAKLAIESSSLRLDAIKKHSDFISSFMCKTQEEQFVELVDNSTSSKTLHAQFVATYDAISEYNKHAKKAILRCQKAAMFVQLDFGRSTDQLILYSPALLMSVVNNLCDCFNIAHIPPMDAKSPLEFAGSSKSAISELKRLRSSVSAKNLNNLCGCKIDADAIESAEQFGQIVGGRVKLLEYLVEVQKFNKIAIKKLGAIADFATDTYKSMISHGPSNITLHYYKKPTCPYCVEFDPMWNKLKQIFKANQDVAFEMLSVQGNTTAPGYITSYPTLICAYSCGLTKFVGERTQKNLTDFINRFL